jgi:hypothetical protein
LAHDFLYCAKIDLNNLKILYSNRKNKSTRPLMVFLIQQAVEKYAKGYALLFGAISKEKIWDINHESEKSFLEILRQEDLTITIDSIKQTADILFQEEMKNLISELSFSEKVMQKTIEVLKNDKISLNEILSNFEALRKDLGVKIYSKKFKNNIMIGLSPFLRQITEKFLAGKTLLDLRRMSYLKYDLICFLLPLICITPQHEQMTRYPNKLEKFKKMFEKISGELTLDLLGKNVKKEGMGLKKISSDLVWNAIEDFKSFDYIELEDGREISREHFLKKPVRILFFVLLLEFEERLFRIHERRGKLISELNEKNLNDLIRELFESDLINFQTEYISKSEFKDDLKAVSSFRNIIMHINKKFEKEVDVKLIIERKKQIIKLLSAIQQITDNMQCVDCESLKNDFD